MRLARAYGLAASFRRRLQGCRGAVLIASPFIGRSEEPLDPGVRSKVYHTFCSQPTTPDCEAMGRAMPTDWLQVISV